MASSVRFAISRKMPSGSPELEWRGKATLPRALRLVEPGVRPAAEREEIGEDGIYGIIYNPRSGLRRLLSSQLFTGPTTCSDME